MTKFDLTDIEENFHIKCRIFNEKSIQFRALINGKFNNQLRLKNVQITEFKGIKCLNCYSTTMFLIA